MVVALARYEQPIRIAVECGDHCKSAIDCSQRRRMGEMDFDDDIFKPNVENMENQDWQAARDELERLAEKAKRLFDRQVTDLKAILMTPAQRELLESLVVSAEVRSWLQGAERDLAWRPFTINEPEFKTRFLETSLFLSQHAD
jgi:hypothetical protein